MTYKITIVPDITDDDSVFAQNGVTLVVSQKDIPYLDGTEIDYSAESLGSQFTFNNPNVKNCCGCGKSFNK